MMINNNTGLNYYTITYDYNLKHFDHIFYVSVCVYLF